MAKKSLETGGGLDFLQKGDFIKALQPLFLSIQNYAKRKFAQAQEFTKAAVEKALGEATAYTDKSVKEVGETLGKQIGSVRADLAADVAKVGADATERVNAVRTSLDEGLARDAEGRVVLQEQINRLKAGQDSFVVTPETFDAVNGRVVEEVAKENESRLNTEGVYAIINNTKQTLYVLDGNGEKREIPPFKAAVSAFDIYGKRTVYIDPSNAEQSDAIWFDKSLATFATKEDVYEVSAQAAAEKVSLFDATAEILKQLESEQD
jgi:hypothetical protein